MDRCDTQVVPMSSINNHTYKHSPRSKHVSFVGSQNLVSVSPEEGEAVAGKKLV